MAPTVVDKPQLAQELSALIIELGQVTAQWHFQFHTGYRHSTESSVAGRDRDGEYSAFAFKERMIDLDARIASIRVLLEYG